MDRVGLSKSRNSVPGALSGGMNAGGAIARSLPARPQFLLLDEPFSSLDVAWRFRLYRELSTLQDEVPPVSFSKIKPIIEKGLGAKISEVFEEFDEKPLAAASVAQVYKAVYKGKEVIAKVIRPDIEKNVGIDIRTLKSVLNLLRTFFFQNKSLISIATVLREFRITIYEEMDLAHEARNIKEFRKIAKETGFIIVPKVYSELTSKNILVMDFHKGIKITNFAKIKEAGFEPKKIIEKLIEFYIYQSLVSGVLHADPHPGNIMVNADGKIVMLDFGLVVHIYQAKPY